MKEKNIFQSFSKDKKFMLVSFFITNPLSVERIHDQWKKRDKEHKICKGRSEEDTKNSDFKNFGGMIGILDPENIERGFLMTFDCPIASGMCFLKGHLYVSSNNVIRVIKGGRFKENISNNIFNDLHGISKFGTNFLIASTGTDSLLEVNPKSKLIEWSWFATENGFEISAEGRKRKILKDFAYDKILTATPQHTTHLNSCLPLDKNNILISLFHQGKIIKLNRKTNTWEEVIKGLKCSHFLRRSKEGFVLSDSLNNQILLFDSSFNLKGTFRDSSFNWIQDCIQLEDGSFLVADSNNFRILKLSEKGKILNELNFGKKKIFTFLSLTKKDLESIFFN